jgi:hypothetical protein
MKRILALVFVLTMLMLPASAEGYAFKVSSPNGAPGIALAVLAAKADLGLLNRRSLAWRGKIGRAVPTSTPASLTGQGFVLRRWIRADDAPFAALNVSLLKVKPLTPKSRANNHFRNNKAHRAVSLFVISYGVLPSI